MGMRINGSASNAGQVTSAANWQQRQQNFKALTSALQSGDINAAKTAFETLTGGKSIPQGSPLAQLGQALQNNDVSGAQQALQGMHHHHGGHHHAAQPDSSTTASNAPVSGSLGTTINVTA